MKPFPHLGLFLLGALYSAFAQEDDGRTTVQKRFPHGSYFVDDSSQAFFTYGSANASSPWQHATNLTAPWNQTLSYNNDLSANITFNYDGGSVSFDIYTQLKYDRGFFDVYLNGEYLGQGDAFNLLSSETDPSVLVFSYSGFAPTGQNNTVVIRNKQDARQISSWPYLTLDFVQVAS